MVTAVAAIVLAVGLIAPAPFSAHAISKQALNHGVLSTIKLIPMDGRGRMFSGCSGTVVNPTGYIVTNWHCVGLTSTDREDDTGQGLKPGDLYHPEGLVVIAPTRDPRKAPIPTYIAQVMAGTPELDVAIVKIVAMFRRGERLPESLPLVVMRLGDSDKLEVGDPVHVVGYPGLGGPLVTVSSGIVSGFDDRNEDGELDSIKTTAEMSGGNSGGLAMNDAGELIGIPTWGQVLGSKSVDRMMMGNLAKPHLEKALQAPPPTPVPTPGRPPPAPSPTPGNGLRPKPAPQPAHGDVTVIGSIVDADTKRPIPNAVFVALKPGTTLDAWDRSEGSELAAAAGVTAEDGSFQTAPPIARSATYTVLAGARGYSRRVFQNGLEIEADEPSVVEVEPIALKRR